MLISKPLIIAGFFGVVHDVARGVATEDQMKDFEENVNSEPMRTIATTQLVGYLSLAPLASAMAFRRHHAWLGSEVEATAGNQETALGSRNATISGDPAVVQGERALRGSQLKGSATNTGHGGDAVAGDRHSIGAITTNQARKGSQREKAAPTTAQGRVAIRGSEQGYATLRAPAPLCGRTANIDQDESTKGETRPRGGISGAQSANLGGRLGGRHGPRLPVRKLARR
jgi:hypothetical protein